MKKFARFFLTIALLNSLALAAAWVVLGRMEPAAPYPGGLAVFALALLLGAAIALAAFYVLVARPLMVLARELDETVREHALQCSMSFTGDEMDYIMQGLVGLREVACQRRAKIECMVTIGDLASSIAHDIKNPLAGISGAMQVLVEDFPEGDDRGDIMREVLVEIERLDCSIKDLLSFARPPEPHPIFTPVSNILECAVERIGPKAQKNNVDVKIVNADTGVMVYVDPDQVQSAIFSMMAFSIKTMQDGGAMTITINSVDQGSGVEVVLKDTGTGLDSEAINALFMPFRTAGHSGAGLSMAISKNLIERQGGRVEVQSSQGSGKIIRLLEGEMVTDDAAVPGTEFRITLPVHK